RGPLTGVDGRHRVVPGRVRRSRPWRAPDVRERLCTPFLTTKARGSGLGLATACRIVEAHEGTVRIECPPGGWTMVVIQLPMQAPALSRISHQPRVSGLQTTRALPDF